MTALITPSALVAGGLFWSVIHTIVAPTPGATFNAAALLRPENLAGLWFVVVFGAIFYAMLIFAHGRSRNLRASFGCGSSDTRCSSPSC